MEVNREKFIEYLESQQNLQKLGMQIVKQLTGEEVQKDAQETVEEIIERGGMELPEGVTKSAAAETLVYNPHRLLKLARGLAKRGEELQERLLKESSDLGTPFEKGASTESKYANESDRVWNEKVLGIVNSK